jgi:hypothetical protein
LPVGERRTVRQAQEEALRLAGADLQLRKDLEVATHAVEAYTDVGGPAGSKPARRPPL